MNPPIARWRAVAFNLSLATVTVLQAVAGIPVVLFARRHAPMLGYYWAVATTYLLKHICGITYEIRGWEHFQENHVIIASKHQSMFDIIALTAIYKTPSYVLKRELLWIPIWGWIIATFGHIAIDRSKGRESMEKILKIARIRLLQGRPILLFPEGTRVPVGEKGKFNPGVAMVYDELKVPIAPVALNTGLFWPRQKWQKRSGKAVIEFLPLIPAGLPMREVLKQLQQAVEGKSQALYVQGLGIGD